MRKPIILTQIISLENIMLKKLWRKMMNNETILIIGAAGNNGTATIESLVKKTVI